VFTDELLVEKVDVLPNFTHHYSGFSNK